MSAQQSREKAVRDELGVKTVETPHHCWKDARIKDLERRLGWRGSDRLAREVKSLIDRGVIGGRSPAADALLDYEQGKDGNANG